MSLIQAVNRAKSSLRNYSCKGAIHIVKRWSAVRLDGTVVLY